MRTKLIIATTVVDALVTVQQERLAAAVEDGRITQEQADERLADLEERVTERVNSEAPVGGHGHGPHGDRGGQPGDDEAPGMPAD